MIEKTPHEIPADHPIRPLFQQLTERGMGPLTDVSLPIVEGEALDETGKVIAGLLLFEYDGWLHYLEVYPFDNTPVPLPPVERARLRPSTHTP